MTKIYEVRYKDGNVIVAHQHASEHFAKLDARQLSKARGRALLGEIDLDKDNLIRACEYAGGVQGKWENRSDAVIPCKILLTVEDTRQEEPSGIEAKPKAEITEEEKAKKKAALEAIRAAQKPKEKEVAIKSETKTPASDKKEKLIAEGHPEALANLICSAGVHVGSPNCKALVTLWGRSVSSQDFPGMKVTDLNAMMTKLRALLISNDTGKSIATKGGASWLTYHLVDFKLEVEEVA